MEFSFPGNGIRQLADHSTLLKNRRLHTIYNGLDSDIYKPGSKKNAREILGLPLEGTRFILFGAVMATTDKVKGFHLLKESLKIVSSSNVELVVFGNDDEGPSRIQDIPVRYLGKINDDAKVISLYQASDIVVIPSLFESFGQMASESLSCGVPVVGFDNAGLKDILKHKENGYLAKAFDSTDFARGIDWILDLNDEDYNIVSDSGRNYVKDHFNSSKVSDQYLELFHSMLKNYNL
jgi:glycosyltransferase involved in cell wall biosynthesis